MTLLDAAPRAASVPPPPPSAWPASSRTGPAAERRSVLLAFAVSGLFWGAFSALLPALQAASGVGDGTLGLALGALAVASLPAMPLAGRLADALGAGPTLQWSLLLFAVAAPLAAVATGPVALVLSLAVLGATTGALEVASNSTAAAWERAERRSAGRLVALAHAVYSFGVLGGSVAAGLLRSWGATPLAVLLLVGGAVAVVAVRVPEHRAASGGGERRGPRRAREGALVLLGLLVAASFLVEDGLQAWSALHLERGLQADPAVSGLGPALFAASMGLARLGAHVLGRHVGDGLQLVGSGLLVGVGATVVALAPSPALALAGLVVCGAGAGVVAPVVLAVVGRRARPGRQGADLALVSALGYGGFVAGPPLVGLVSGLTSLPVALGLMGAVGLVAGLAGPLCLRLAAAGQRR